MDARAEFLGAQSKNQAMKSGNYHGTRLCFHFEQEFSASSVTIRNTRDHLPRCKIPAKPTRSIGRRDGDRLHRSHVILSRQLAHAARHFELEQRRKHLGRSQLRLQQLENLHRSAASRPSAAPPAPSPPGAAAPDQPVEMLEARIWMQRRPASSSSRTCEGRSSHTSSHVATSLAPCLINVLGVHEPLLVTLPGTAYKIAILLRRAARRHPRARVLAGLHHQHRNAQPAQ